MRRSMCLNVFFWNRIKDQAFMTKIIDDTSIIHLITGGPSCGKTALVRKSLENNYMTGPCRSVFAADLRGLTIHKGPDMCEQHLRLMITEARQSVLGAIENAAWLLQYGIQTGLFVKVFGDVTPTVDTVVEALRGMAEQMLAASKEPDAILGLTKAIDAAASSILPPVLFFDEINLLKSDGDPEFKWRDDLFKLIMTLSLRVTKQNRKATVIFGTSDQQFTTQLNSSVFEGKDFAEVYSLGYLSDTDAHEYLQDPDAGYVVTDEKIRNKIINVVGGSFLRLERARKAVAEDNNDSWDGTALEELLDHMMYKIKNDAEKRFISLRKQPGADEAATLMKHLAPMLVAEGYASIADLPVRHTSHKKEMVVNALLAANLVGMRWHTNSTWSDDIPAARKANCLVPFSPIDKTWLGDDQFIEYCVNEDE